MKNSLVVYSFAHYVFSSGIGGWWAWKNNKGTKNFRRIVHEDRVSLYSYDTEVARVVRKPQRPHLLFIAEPTGLSSTTKRHIALLFTGLAEIIPGDPEQPSPTILRIPAVLNGDFNQLLLVERPRPWSRWPLWDYHCGFQSSLPTSNQALTNETRN